MGFNNWNATHCRPEFDENMIKGVADLMVAKGLRDAGYEYVNLDDCWALPWRGPAGELVPDPGGSRTGSRRWPATCTPRG